MSNLESLQQLLNAVRSQALDEAGDSDISKQRDKGTFFEDLTRLFLEKDKQYNSIYKTVYTYAEWATAQSISGTDAGIDLVAIDQDGGVCAIQCKFYASDYKLQKKDIDSFMTASGKEPFTHRLVVDSTSGDWSKNAEDAINNQQIPVTRLTITEMADGSVDWSRYNHNDKTVPIFSDTKTLRAHQQKALEKVQSHFKTQSRGQLIMACGTGKTFTSLKIAEQEAGIGKRVLYLVPSLALMQQTIKEWFIDTAVPIYGLSVCSDSSIGKANDDFGDISLSDLAIPATTKPNKIADKVKNAPTDKMIVVFSTYQSIQVVSDAQKNHAMGDFDIVICDEAHRTTGVTLSGDDESHFVKVHNEKYIGVTKRLYMTATPRVYGDTAKTKAGEINAVLAQMDDESLYGSVIDTVSFNYAVENGLLSDYKVIVLALSEGAVDASFQKLFSSEDFELNLEDTTKLIGCYKALSKLDLLEDEITDKNPMHRAITFCQNIKKSKSITEGFVKIADSYRDEVDDKALAPLSIEMEHIDGTFNAGSRKQKLNWLKDKTNDDTCRILSNALCLSEGVDVPSLDAVMFLHPRKSQVDVVQAVGRVMRKAEGKKMGYVILPVAITAGIDADVALNNNKKYEVVWQVLNALRSHDERLDGTINRASLGGDISDKIEIIAVTDILPNKKTQTTGDNIGDGGDSPDASDKNTVIAEAEQKELNFQESVNQAIIAKLVSKCGTRDYWEDWATDIADIAKKHIVRITNILETDEPTAEIFEEFLIELQDDLNPSISKADAIEMLAQHIITKPVFDSLFAGYDFTSKNTVSIALQKVVDVIQSNSLDTETDSLDKFYASVQRRVDGIKSITEKQAIIVELYDKFFKKAFPRTTESMGIVYTPTEVVDFIIHSINDVLVDEFGTSIGEKGVNIIDPFTGTGTFVTRLLQSGLISPEQLEYKYKNEIHANEIILLAYYIANINIEQVYHEITQETDYTSFEGICLTDTFQMYESEDMVQKLMPDNSERRKKQKALDVTVIMGNPPYSAGQKSANDNAQNVIYPDLDRKIKKTYVANTTATNKNSLYDSYIRAIKWGSERLGEHGVMGYVSGNGYLEKSAMDGVRKCLAIEYSNLYVFNLRGDIRKNMLSKGRAGEGQNVFGSGSMTGITITLFIKNTGSKTSGNIYYHDVGNDLTTKQKLNIIKSFKSINGIKKQSQNNTQNGNMGWQEITPDKYNDWLNQRDDSFYEHIAIGDKVTKGTANTQAIFANYSRGLATSRDAWCYNSSKNELEGNVKSMIDFYNSEADRYQKSDKTKDIKDFINNDSTKISWGRQNLKDGTRNKKYSFENISIMKSSYRPFTKQWVYFNKNLNDMIYQLPKIFPMGTDLPNRCICVTGVGSRSGFNVYIVDTLPDLGMLEACQIFPLKLYEQNTGDDLLSQGAGDYLVRDGITNYAQNHFTYGADVPSKEDVFYYTYGLLNHLDYTAKWQENLAKALPHIPKVKTYDAFKALETAGRELAELHINYESVEPYQVNYKNGAPELLGLSDADYYVTKMKFDKSGKENNKTTIIYNDQITITGIPLDAYDYMVSGKPAIEWVMDRQQENTNNKSASGKASQIINNANDYATETMGDAKYPLLLLLRVITVSIETQKIIKSLPKLDF